METENQIVSLREWYGKRVRDKLNLKGDMRIPVGSAVWLDKFVSDTKPRKIVEFGSGFSTLLFTRSIQSYKPSSLVSLDHSTGWIRFVRECAKDLRLGGDVTFETVHRFWGNNAKAADGCELMFVDHGPTYDVRIASLPVIIGLARRIGCTTILLDDWHKARRRFAMYRSPATDVIKQCGLRVEFVAESSRPSEARGLARINISGTGGT